MKKIINKSIGLLTVVLMFLIAFTMPINAAEEGSITVINKTQDGDLLSDVDVKLYKVADFTDNSRTHIILSDDFKEFQLDIDELLSTGDAETSARSCNDFIDEHAINAVAEGKTDDTGVVTFSNIQEGIYLVTQNYVGNEDFAFETTPFYVQVPYTDSEGNVVYQVTSHPKNGVTYPQETYEVSVVKLWKDNNNRDNTRPESIEVGLYGNEELIETVTLSDINNWSYIWSDLSKDIVWDVKEMVIPDNYRMSVENNQNQFTITNQLVIHRESITHGAIETVKGDKTSIKSVATGDTTVLGFYIALFALSGLCILIYVKRCKEQN